MRDHAFLSRTAIPGFGRCRECGLPRDAHDVIEDEHGNRLGFYPRSRADAPDTQCPKCLDDMDRLHYAQADERWPECFRYDCPWHEHMHRECGTCGYGRWELCADGEQTPNTADAVRVKSSRERS